MTKGVQELYHTLDDLAAKVAHGVERLDGHDTAIAALGARIDKLQAANDDLHRDNAAQQQQVETLNKRIGALESSPIGEAR